MSEIAYQNNRKALLLRWIPDTFFRPRRAFQNIASATSAIWFTPLLVLTILILVNVMVTGRLKSQAAQMGEISYPPDYQYYTPEQQAQYMQAIQSTQGPVFVYVLPAIISIIGVCFGWLVLGGLLHLVTTLFGGRGSTSASMNIVAWASLPLGLRSLVGIVYMLISQKLITNAGLSGFSPASGTGLTIFFGHFLKLIDIYLIWQVLLIILGVRLSTKLNPAKTTSGALITVLIVMLLQAAISYSISLLGNLTITRPFFF